MCTVGLEQLSLTPHTPLNSTIQLGTAMTYFNVSPLFMIRTAYTFSQFVTCVLTFLIEIFTYIFKLYQSFIASGL